MSKQENVEFVISTLNNLYPEIPIPLEHKDPYTLLIAVLMSAQSTDVRVNQITPLLFEKANNPYDMIKLSVEDIRNIIKPVGLSPMKSKGIFGLSKILIEKYKESPYTRITFIPDYAKFNLTGMSEDLELLIKKRAVDMFACSRGQLDIYFNNEKMKYELFIHKVSSPSNKTLTINKSVELNENQLEFVSKVKYQPNTAIFWLNLPRLICPSPPPPARLRCTRI